MGLRVLVLTTSYPLRATSSSGVFVRRLVEALTAHAQMQVLCPADASAEPVDGGARVILLPFRYAPRRWQRLAQEPGGVLPAIRARPALLLLLPWFLLAFSWRLVRAARRVDVIHANWAITGALAALLRPLHRRPVVLTLRGDDVTVARRSGIHRHLLHYSVAHAHTVVCVAESMARNLEAEVPASAPKVRVVLNGVGGEFRPPVAASGFPARIVFVGSLIPRKGADVLLRAFARMQDSAVVLRFVGDGPERASLQSLGRSLAVDDRLEFCGQVAPEQVADHLAASTLFVLPSYSEGRPNVLLEAMAGGVPVVASRIDGVVDTVREGEHAWLFDAGDVDALTVVLNDAMARPEERQRRALAARRHVEISGWSWEAAARRYADIFAAAASRSGVA
ncbi:MAG: glycosyltransferase [Rhodanobacteraceae bacterium]|nr:glycosyltransferase [Rhodanobacteraceae bacterium]